MATVPGDSEAAATEVASMFRRDAVDFSRNGIKGETATSFLSGWSQGPLRSFSTRGSHLCTLTAHGNR